jgi:hypothetical protein
MAYVAGRWRYVAAVRALLRWLFGAAGVRLLGFAFKVACLAPPGGANAILAPFCRAWRRWQKDYRANLGNDSQCQSTTVWNGSAALG